MPHNHTYADLLDSNAWIRKTRDTVLLALHHPHRAGVQALPGHPLHDAVVLQRLLPVPRAAAQDRGGHARRGDRRPHARDRQQRATSSATACMPEFYLAGRQFLIDLGMLKPTDALDDLVVRRGLRRAAQPRLPPQPRPRAALSDNNLRAQLLPERQRAGVRGRRASAPSPATGCTPRSSASWPPLDQYALLSHCESRLGIFNHGPYRCRANDGDARARLRRPRRGRPAVARRHRRRASPHNNLTIPVIMKDTHFNILDDWSSFEAQPSYDHDNVVAVGLYTSDYLSDGYLPVAMDNASDDGRLPRPPARDPVQGDGELWKDDGGLEPRPDARRGRHVVLRRAARTSRTSRASTTRTTGSASTTAPQRFKPLINDEYGARLPRRAAGLRRPAAQQGSPYTMSKWSAAARRHVVHRALLGAHRRRVHGDGGPIRSRQLVAARKTALHHDPGQLTQDECNERARAFVPSTLRDGLVHLDDTWLKNHRRTPGPRTCTG